MLRKVSFQLFSLTIVSLLFGYWTSTIGVNIIVGALTGAVIQFLGYSVFSTVLNSIVLLKNKKLENERLKEFSYQGLELECPCYKKEKELVPVRFNTPNYYRCNACNKQLSVIVTAESAVVTEPILNTDLSSLDTSIIEKAIQ
jgi:hypothetical protein